MKKYIVKKIFKVFGIVLASVLGFVGVVVGVMALMGKFKTPVVYPTVLGFAVTEQTIIEADTFDPELDWTVQNATIYSFEIVGSNPSFEHEVNQKECYLWFDDGGSAELITLCYENGKPLPKDSNNRYLVNCNEPIYYMVNELDENTAVGETDGRVVLQARSTNDTLKKPDSPMTIWIDRKVESVFVKDGDWNYDYWRSTVEGTNPNIQNISLGMDIGFDFEYAVDTLLSIKPISKESAKEIELYYVATGYSNDYIKVTEQEVSNVNSPLNSIMSFENGVFSFKSSVAKKHKFIIGVFPTYQSKIDYEESVKGVDLVDPNYKRTTNMVITTLNITVENVEISKVGFAAPNNVVLNLYSQHDYITLNGLSGVSGAKDNNLCLYMRKSSGASEVEDFSRFDEVTMNGFDGGDIWVDDRKARFEQSAIESFVYDGYLITLNGNIYKFSTSSSTICIETSGVKFSDTLEVISFVYKDGGKANPYYCTNGVPVLDTSGSNPTIKILTPGSYMNFYAKKVDASGKDIYQILDFEHEAISTGKGQAKSWNIITKEMPDPSTGDYLCFGILVVNNSGKFEVKNFFDTIPVNVEVMPLDFTINEEKVDKEINFVESDIAGGGIEYPEMPFSDFVTINGGSYNSCVFVVEEKLDGDGNNINMVNVISNIKYEVGTPPNKKTYVLVGNIEKDVSGNDVFVNSVKLNSNVAKDNNTCELVMLQLKNGFKKGANDLLDPLLTLGATLSEDEVCNIYPLDVITVNAKYVLNASLLEYEYYDYYESAGSANNIVTSKNGNDVYTVYENTDDLTIVINSKNISMWDIINNFYEFDVNYFEVLNYDSNLEIKEAEIVDGELIIAYETHSCLSDQNIVISILLENIGDTLELPGIIILSGSPTNIALNAGDGHIITLENSIELAKNSVKYLTVVVGYDAINNKYIYSYILNDNGITYNITEDIFNEDISSPLPGEVMSIGFQDAEDKGQTLGVEYDAVDKAIFNTLNLSSGENLVEKSGSTVLSVKIGETTQYIKIVADTSAFTIATTSHYNNSPSWDKTSIDLDELVELNYDSTNPITLAASQLVKVTNVKCASYGDGNLITYPLAGGGWELKKSETDPTVLTVEEVGGVWNFKKTVSYVNLTISFDVETVADSNLSNNTHDNLNLRLTFGSSISAGVNNVYWEDRIIYSGTEVQLMDMSGDYALFDITTEFGTETVKFEMISNAGKFEVEGTSSAKYTFGENLIGNISIKVYVNDVSISEFGFNVKPNIVATLKDVDYQSETNYSVSSLYELKSYLITKTYGSSSDDMYSKIVYYTDDTYTTVSPTETEFVRNEANSANFNPNPVDTTKLNVMANGAGNTNPQLTGGANLLIGQMTELNETKTREINLLYTYNAGASIYTISTDNIRIVNKYLVTTSMSGEDASTTYKALKEYNSFVTLDNAVTGASDFELDNIVCDGMEIEINATKTGFKIQNTVVQNLEGVQFVATFKHKTNGQILTFTTQGEDYNIIPYIPTELSTQEVAYSNSTYDLLNGIYNADDDAASDYVVNDGNITKLFVTAILDEEGNDISSTVAPGFVATGYTSGSLEPRCLVTFSEISGDSLQVFVQFTITYVDDKTYTYSIPLTINNRQKIEVKYPEQDIKLSSGVFKFVDGYTQDALELSGETEVNADGIYELKDMIYEPTLVYTNSSTVLNFKYDEIKKINRAVVTDAKTNDVLDAVLDIKVIAYQNNAGMAAYAKAVVTNYADNQVSLPQSTQGMFGTLVFRLTTESGNYKHYFVYVYCNGASNVVNGSNIMHVVAENGSTYPSNFTEESAVNVDIATVDSTTTYVNLISGLSKYFDVFKISYNANTTKLFLYNGTFAGETPSNAFNYNDKQWKVLTNDDEITINEYFNTITIGLINDDGVKRYFYGTIVIYVQPNVSVSETGLTYSYPSGEFVKDLASDTSEINCPFGTDWSADVESITVDGVDFELETTEVGSDVTIAKRVEKDTLIRVKYTSNSIGTIAYVTYKYLATEIPNQEELDVNPIVLGNFIDKTNGFNNSINLAATANYETFFGTYQGAYTIVSSDTNGEVSGSSIEFTQTTEQQNITVTITYSDFGTSGTTRDFTFIIRPGVYVDVTSVNTESGLSSDHAKSTVAIDDFTSFKGSSLEFTYTSFSASGGIFYAYQVGDLIIYTTATSKLKLSFDLNNYVLNSTQDAVLSGADTLDVEPVSKTDVYFVHSAENKLVVMNIKVLNSADDEYVSRNFYINVVQTYSTLQPTYLVDGAQYQNVPSGDESITNLHETLFDTAKTVKLKLIDGTVKDDADLSSMGFTTYGNPNYIKFTTSGNAIISDYASNPVINVKFNNVTKNTMCQVFLNNDAGIVKNSVVYDYQIMASANVDGLNFEDCNGHYDNLNEYVSFVLEDVGAVANAYTSKKFVLGSMLDMKNEGIFTLDDISLNDSEPSGSQILLIEEGYYVDDITTGAVNESSLAVVGEYTNAIQYILKYSGTYLFYLTLDLDTKNVELVVARIATMARTNEFKISLSLGGVNGEKTILNEFKVYLNNTQAVSNYQAMLDTTIYSGDIIDLFADGKITENGGSTPTLTYEMANSSYTVAGKSYTIKASDIDNDLFKYDSSAKRIQTKTVGEKVTVELNLTVKHTTLHYVLKNITYNFNINLNMQIVVNGADLASNEGNSSPETHFVLTTVEDVDTDGQFPIVINFESYKNLQTADESNNYYKVLVFDLYRLRLQGNEDATDEEKIMERNNVEVELFSAPSSCFSVSKSGIEFVKDYTGDIELKLSVKTDTGTYYVIWTIYVTGIATLENVSLNSDFNRVQNNSLPFNSGVSVDIVNGAKETGTGIVMTAPNSFASQFRSKRATLSLGDSTYGYYKKEADGSFTLITDVNATKIEGIEYYHGIKATYSYVINTFNETTKVLTNEQLFNNNDENKRGEGSGAGAMSSHSYQVVLPSVPSTTSDIQQSYLVTYKIYLEYLGLEYDNSITDNNKQEVQVFYISYDVINYQSVETYKTASGKASAVINVDTDLDETYLDLFHYADVYTTSTNEYKFVYTNNKVQLKVSTITAGTPPVVTPYDYDSSKDSGNNKFFVEGVDVKYSYSLNPGNQKLYDESGVEISGGTWSKVPYYEEYSADKFYNSVFSSSKFANIFEFKNFIDLYYNEESVKLTNEEGTELDYKLVEIKDGRYGIDLKEDLVAPNKLFNNEMRAELALLDNGVKTLVINKYTDANASGFRLYTNSTITAKSNIKLSQMFLSTYFTKNAAVANNTITISSSIIGVGDPTNAWVDGGSISSRPTTNYAHIKIPSSLGNVKTYNVKKVVYSGGNGDLYNITEEFYYIAESSAAVVVPDYNAVGIETTFFKIPYSDAAATVSFDAKDAVKVWYMNANKLEWKRPSSITSISTEIIDGLSAGSGVIAMERSVLDNYKLNNPTKKNFEPFYITITAKTAETADGVSISMYCEVVFSLYDYVRVEVDHTAGSTDNITQTLLGKVAIPEFNANYDVVHNLLTSSNLSKIQTIAEKGANGYIDYRNGDLILNGAKVNEYFVKNSLQSKLSIICTITTEAGSIDFEVVVKKT